MKTKNYYRVLFAVLTVAISFSLTACEWLLDELLRDSGSSSISVSSLSSFGILEKDYAQPAAQTITITNKSTGFISLTQPTAKNYTIGKLSKTGLEKGEKATFTIRPILGLGIGTYNEIIKITGTNNVSAEINAQLAIMEDKIVTPIMQSSKSSPTNIVFLGDGFLLEDFIRGGLFESKAKELLDYIISIQPFTGYTDYISAYWVSSVSENRGAKTNPNDSMPKTLFNSTYNYLGTERLLVAQNYDLVRTYSKIAVDSPHIIVIIVNDSRYGGSGGEFSVTSVHNNAKEITIHEIGHVFGLADEYIDENFIKASDIKLENAAKQLNLDVTNDLSAIKWKHFVNRNGYNDNAYEGGYYFAKGVWRPTEESIMRSYKIMEFNAISRETIVKKIIANAGETYNLQEFLARDVPPAGLRSVSALRGSDNPMPVPVEVYASALFGDERIRARFIGED